MATANPLDSLSRVPLLRERQTTAAYVAGSLRAAIQSGQLPDGSELNQVALAEHFGISRVPVREALRALEAEGWITARAHHRAVVQALSSERIAETFELRALLEVHLVEKAIGHIDDAHIARLRALCDEMDAMDDHPSWVAANREFHRLLHECAGSPLTVELVEGLSSQVERYLRIRGESVIREGEAGAEHRAILQAAIDHDAGTARDRIRAHIDHTKRRVMEALAATRPEST